MSLEYTSLHSSDNNVEHHAPHHAPHHASVPTTLQPPAKKKGWFSNMMSRVSSRPEDEPTPEERGALPPSQQAQDGGKDYLVTRGGGGGGNGSPNNNGSDGGFTQQPATPLLLGAHGPPSVTPAATTAPGVKSHMTSVLEGVMADNECIASVFNVVPNGHDYIARALIFYHALWRWSAPGHIGCIHTYTPNDDTMRAYDWKVRVQRVTMNPSGEEKLLEAFEFFDMTEHHTIVCHAILALLRNHIGLTKDEKNNYLAILYQISKTFPLRKGKRS